MNPKKVLLLPALVFILETCSVIGQTRVEYISQPCSSPQISSGPIVQTAPQLVVPAIIKPMLQPCESYLQDPVPIVPNFNSFGGCPYSSGIAPAPGPMPPIILDDGDDDNWHHLLYFLIFAMRNRRCGGGYGYGGCGGGYGYGNGCGGGCGGSCGGNYGACGNYGAGFSNNAIIPAGNCGNFNYIPYPIPVPMNGPYNFGSFSPDASCGCVDDCGCPAASPNNNEISLIIRTDSNCNCN